jgi:hypothetical protein
MRLGMTWCDRVMHREKFDASKGAYAVGQILRTKQP